MNADKSFPTTATETVALSINRATKQPGRAADWKSTLPTTKTKRAAEMAALSFLVAGDVLRKSHVRGLKAFGALDHVELNVCAL